MTEIKLKRRGIVYCEDCSHWDKSVCGHIGIDDHLCRRQMRWTTEMDYCSDGQVAEQTEPQYDVDKGTIRCDNCSENGSYKCTKCDGEMYFKRLEDEPQIRCPKCGRTDYIKSFEKDFGIKDSSYKYKCINCNTYIKDEPTISKMEQVDKDINVRSKDEPQTDCPWK